MNSAAPTEYDDSLKVRDALQVYFSLNHFKNGGYHLKWFKIKLGPVYIPFPNTKGRLDAVKIHDIHHLVTNYAANLKGETEIGAWEIASGCGNYYVAWVLNFGSFFYGMFFYPRFMYRAFLRGRRCASNLYYDTLYDELLLNKTIGELRAAIEVDSSKKNSRNDYLIFALCCILSLTAAAVFVLSLYLIARFLI